MSEKENTSDTSDAIISDTQSEGESERTNDEKKYYLRQLRNEEFVRRLKEKSGLVLPLPPSAMERSFDRFTAALARTFLVAQRTPLSRTQPGTQEEMQHFSSKIGVDVDLTVPEYSEGDGNLLEIKRMVLTSLEKWNAVWKPPFADGVNAKRLYKDIIHIIASKAERRKLQDAIRLCLPSDEGRVFCYEDADWRQTMEEDLGDSDWDQIQE